MSATGQPEVTLDSVLADLRTQVSALSGAIEKGDYAAATGLDERLREGIQILQELIESPATALGDGEIQSAHRTVADIVQMHDRALQTLSEARDESRADLGSMRKSRRAASSYIETGD